MPTAELVLTDENPIAEIMLVYIKTKSSLTGTIEASGAYGSTITNYLTTIGEKNIILTLSILGYLMKVEKLI